MSDGLIYRLGGVRRSYAGSFDLHVERLEVFSGEILCLLGPTGAGKSTLLRLLAGLEPASSGDLYFENHRLDGRSLPLTVRRRITMVFQRPLLLSGTVRYNVEYGLHLRRRSLHPAMPAVILDRLGLAGIASKSARTLSGGQQQLVALARVLVIEPDVLLLDEPTSNLDPARVALVEEVITEANRQRGMTVIWATHNLFQARRVARRVGLLLNGRLIEVATASNFFESPSDPRTAAFVRGEMIY